MSLVVWLPLTKDLRNQGLSNVTVTNNGATFNSAGKLGGCYSFNASGYLKETSFNWSNFNTSEFSLCCWYKEPSPVASGNSQMICIGTSSGWNNIRIGLLRRTSNGYPMFSVSDGTNNVNYSFTADSFTLDTWNHIVCTYNNGTMKMYLNGTLHKTATTTIIPALNSSQHLGIGAASNGSEKLTGYLNDVRIYDHCLSPMEVKRISQGLACHYNLSDGTAESTTNIITTEDCLTSTCYNGATSKYGYGTTTDMYKIVTTFDGKKGTKVYMRTNGNPAFPYVYIGNMYTSNGGSYPLDRTLSFDYYSTISTSIRPYKLGSGSGTATYRVQNASTGISTGTGTDAVMIPVKPNMWNHIEITFHNTTTDSAQWGYIQNYPSHTSDTSNFWFFANMQLENKDHATAYAGVGGTRTSTTIYDTSGYCNNGTIIGDLTISTDTPKYQTSIHMPTAATISHPRCLDNASQEWTCAAWVKPDAAGNYQNLNNFNESNRLYHGTYPLLYLNSGTNDYYNYGNLALPANQWSHIVFVFKNSTGTKLIYVNGENRTNTGGPNKTSTPKGIPDTVIVGGSYAGYMCDYREYATALSADDVKSLYQNCATIDADGTIHGQIRS